MDNVKYVRHNGIDKVVLHGVLVIVIRPHLA